MSRGSTERHGAGWEPAAATLLSRSTLMTIRRALHAYREGWLLDDRLARAARMVVDDARLRAASAEAMLLALRRAWTTLEDPRWLPADEATALLGRLVTLAIECFHGGSPRHPVLGPTAA